MVVTTPIAGTSPVRRGRVTALAIAYDVYRISLLSQALREHLRRAWFVFNEQNPHRVQCL